MNSRIILGTAQFGSDYGLSNLDGMIPYSEAKSIIDYAYLHGISALDTASNYGESEKVLGKIGVNKFNCVTKLKSIPKGEESIRSWVEKQIKESQDKLKIDKLYGVLFHNPDDLLKNNGHELLEQIIKYKDLGLIKKIGFSIYDPKQLDELTKIYWPDIVQTPFNIFDQRIKNSGWLEILNHRNIEVHARSIFLQGLLLMNPKDRPFYFRRWKDHFSAFDKFINESKLKPIEASLSHAYQEKRIDKFIIGVNNLNQLKELLDINITENYNFEHLSHNNEDLLEPYRWEIN